MRLASAALVLVPTLLAACSGADALFTDPNASPSQPALLNDWSPAISIVFAQGKTAAQSYRANISVWPTNKVLCDQPPNPAVNLYVSKNGEPGDFVDQAPALTQRHNGSVTFPSEEFNDVPARLAADPSAQYSFVAVVRGQPGSNVWLHAGPGKAPAGEQVKPSGYASPDPAALDARIQVVFPHDEQGRPAGVKSATRVNIAVDLFQHGTTLSVPPDASYRPRLWMARDNDRLRALPPGVHETTYTVDGQGYPRWVFNDVNVEPGQTYHFLATVGPVGQPGGAYPSIWTYVPEARTAPTPRTPPACIP